MNIVKDLFASIREVKNDVKYFLLEMKLERTYLSMMQFCADRTIEGNEEYTRKTTKLLDTMEAKRKRYFKFSSE